MTIKAIEARFTSGNDIPVQKAMVPADEWKAAKAEIERRDAVLRMALECIKETRPHEEDYDFGPAFSMATKRRENAIKAIKATLE